MKIHNSQRKLRTAEARKLHLAERAGKGVVSAADQALFFQKSRATSKEETETAGEAVNAPVNVFFTSRNRKKKAGKKATRMDGKRLRQEKKIFRKRLQTNTLNDRRTQEGRSRAEWKKERAVKKKDAAVFHSKKSLQASDIVKGTGAAVIGAMASEVGSTNEETKKAIIKVRQISRISQKAKRTASVVKTGYQGGKLLTKAGMKVAGAFTKAVQALVVAVGPLALLLCCLIVAISVLLIVISGGMEEEEKANQSLCPYGNMYYWIKWETGTWDVDEAFSTTLGDGGKAYGIQFDYRYGLIPFNRSCYQSDSERYEAFEPYITKGSVALNDQKFAKVWKQVYQQNKEDFAERQKAYAKNQYYTPVAQYLKKRGMDLEKYSDVVKGAVLSFSWQHGVGGAQSNIPSVLKKGMSDGDAIAALYQKRKEIYPANKARYQEEEEYAQSLLVGAVGDAGGMVGSNVVGTAEQKRIVQYATSGNSFGLGQGWCQAWVANVYQKATGVRNSKCCAAACRDAWATTKGDIPVGAAIYSGKGYRSRTNCSCGRNAGHVGIYIGNGKVVSMVYGPTTQSLKSWYNYYGYGGWSWNGGKAADK